MDFDVNWLAVLAGTVAHLAALFGGYYTIGLIAAGAILGAWK